MPLRLRPFQIDDETAALRAQELLKADDFQFLLGRGGGDWAGYLTMLRRNRQGLDLDENRVRAALLAAEVDGVIVGRASIRFELNDWLAERGGHIGYCVLPEFRARGYATDILRQALDVARYEGVERVLVICDDDNVASAATIERCGGVLERVVEASDADTAFRRYWIGRSAPDRRATGRLCR